VNFLCDFILLNHIPVYFFVLVNLFVFFVLLGGALETKDDQLVLGGVRNDDCLGHHGGHALGRENLRDQANFSTFEGRPVLVLVRARGHQIPHSLMVCYHFRSCLLGNWIFVVETFKLEDM